MKEAIYIEWESCSKCYMMKPHVKKRSEENWYEFQTFRFDDESVKEFDIQSVPMLVIREEWVVKDIYNEEGIVSLISNNK
jgi:predicted DsbA family dithiol-disulfide isomerase